MCGRFGLTASSEELADWLGLEEDEVRPFQPRFNVAPGQPAQVVRPRADGRLAVRPVHWGLVPSWAKDRGLSSRLINARAETAAHKPAFRDAMSRRRCLIAADGFYEWQKVSGQRARRPWHVGLDTGGLFALGGLWERWRDPATGQGLDTFCILTTRPNPLIAQLHDRMPVIIGREHFHRWLDRSSPGERVGDLMEPASAQAMVAWPVTTRLNDVSTDDAACRAPDGPVLRAGASP